MCGIACIAGKNKFHLFDGMLNTIKHRGPDGSNKWQNTDFALGHARLSIIDLSQAANQPMVDDFGNVLIFNGEIYNYLELRKQLSNNYVFKTDSDSEVILAAYQILKERCVEILRGMFSFIIYDNQTNKLFVARDRFGIKPLYYRKYVGAIAFSSEIKSLVNQQNESKTLNEEKAYEFIVHRRLDTDTNTLFNEVKQLKQGCYIWVDSDGNTTDEKSYWTFPKLGEKKITSNTFEDIYQKLDETVALHLRSDVPVGSFLSGGVDSSVISAISLQHVSPQNWHTFSAILPYYQQENALIEDFHNFYPRIKRHDFQLNGSAFFDDIEKIIFHHDEPILDGSMYAHYKLCEIAARNKIKVVLSGSGGDELFSGYKSYIDAGLAQKLKSLDVSGYFKMINKLSHTSQYSKASLIQKSIWELLPFEFRKKIKERQATSLSSIVNKEYKIELYPFRNKDPFQANLLNNFYSWTVPPYLHYEDRNCMAHGVEVRVPFLDHKLIEFVLQFDYTSFLNGNTKSVLRNSVKYILPEKIVNQKGKFGFPSPIDHALQKDKKGKEMFYDTIKNVDFINQKEAIKLANNFYDTGENLILYWRTLSFSIWHNLFFS